MALTFTYTNSSKYPTTTFWACQRSFAKPWALKPQRTKSGIPTHVVSEATGEKMALFKPESFKLDCLQIIRDKRLWNEIDGLHPTPNNLLNDLVFAT
ncbi:hypothetical protein QE152_g9883 [Popillia japonica]|uniref:Uncharacterized protein n=1 Tax=Popillia japonica TaxID=7064 RepID=A0AAW1LWC8_POPJA